MKKTRFATGFFGLCLLLASCGQDDMPNQENMDGALRPMTLTATLPEGMTTRAGADYDDSAPTRCYVQILGTDSGILSGDQSDVKQMVAANGSFSLTVTLDPSRTYNFLFWADNASGETAPTSLTNVSYRSDGTVIAFADKLEDQGYVSGGINATLEHVVTRISVRTTAAVTIDDTHRLTVKAPCYTTYDVSAMQSGNPGNELTYPFSNGTFAAGDHVGHFYVLGDGTQQNLTITYEGTAGQNSAELSNVPLLPNYHITLQGDITNVGLAEYLIEASVDSGWNTGEEVDFPGYTLSADGQTYTVTTADGLLAWNEAAQNDLTIGCTLTADIDLTGKTWTPIGTYDNPYTGTFDGGGHTITGLTVTGSDRYAGLFGYIGTDGKVMNVKLENVQITNDNSLGYAGGVAGNSWGTIENCSVSGSVIGRGMYSIVGGVVGYQFVGSITGCSSSATVNTGKTAGGVAGSTYSATLTGCYATGSVSVANNTTNDAYAGGVVGDSTDSSTLIACYATGSVTGSGSGTIYVGGVTGSNADGTLLACYHANGTVSGPAGTTGGVAGQNYKAIYDPVITACYWGSNGQTQGIGYNQASTGETTLVDGTNVKWEDTIDPMNAALSGSGWQYEIGDEGLPVFN